jgi:hypothetical protein
VAHIYVKSQSLAPGVEVEISGHPIDAGEKVPVEFSDNNRAEAIVLGSGSSVLEIKVGDGLWRLAPLVPAELMERDPADQATPATWKVQP